MKRTDRPQRIIMLVLIHETEWGSDLRLPGDHCYINVADFPESRQLVTYLNYLDLHSGGFDEYFARKSLELRRGFRSSMPEASNHWIERLVDHLGAES